MRTFNYAWLSDRKWDTDLLGLIAAIYKEAGKQEIFLKQWPAKLEKLVNCKLNLNTHNQETLSIA